MSLLSLLTIWCKALVSVNSIVDVIISFKFCFVQIGNFCKVLGLSKYFVNHKLYLNLRLVCSCGVERRRIIKSHITIMRPVFVHNGRFHELTLWSNRKVWSNLTIT